MKQKAWMLLSAIALAGGAAADGRAAFDYERHWTQVEQYITDRLPASALNEVELILDAARARPRTYKIFAALLFKPKRLPAFQRRPRRKIFFPDFQFFDRQFFPERLFRLQGVGPFFSLMLFVEFGHAASAAPHDLKEADHVTGRHVADAKGAGPGHFQPEGQGAQHDKLAGTPVFPVGSGDAQGKIAGFAAGLTERHKIQNRQQR